MAQLSPATRRDYFALSLRSVSAIVANMQVPFHDLRAQWRIYLAAGILPAVEPGVPPGGR